MKGILLIVGFVVAAMASLCFAANVEQAGTAGSGTSSSGAIRLESVIGQTVAGFSGQLTSGFFAGEMLPNYLPGDPDNNGMANISDVVYLISYIFAGGPAPAVLASGDLDCSGNVNISDAVYLVNYIFAGGPWPHFCN